MAAQENHIEVVKYLLENGANQSTATEVSPPQGLSVHAVRQGGRRDHSRGREGGPRTRLSEQVP